MRGVSAVEAVQALSIVDDGYYFDNLKDRSRIRIHRFIFSMNNTSTKYGLNCDTVSNYVSISTNLVYECILRRAVWPTLPYNFTSGSQASDK